MLTEEILQAAEKTLQPWAKATSHPDPVRLDVEIAAEDLPVAVTALLEAHLGYMAAISGVDEPATEEGAEGRFEVLYHFCEGAAIITLRVHVPYSDAVVPTLSDQWPSAGIYEQELRDMFGVQVRGLANAGRLLLSDDWPEGVHPLRKSFTGLPTDDSGQGGA